MTDAARATVMALLAARAPGATICPSEAARAIAPGPEWRGAMVQVHAAVDGLTAEGIVRLSWKGRALGQRSGPYRIALATPAGFEPAT